MSKRRFSRKSYVIYEPNYVSGGGKNVTVYSRRQALKLCSKWGTGCHIVVLRFRREREDVFPGGISFWNCEKEYTYSSKD